MNRTLAAFLAAPQRPEGTMNYTELHGFLFAVACCPVTVEPSEWITLIFNEEDANFANEDEAEEILQGIAAAYNEIYDELSEGEALLPECCQILTPPMANFGAEATLAAWSRGFLEGHEWLTAAWEQGIPKALDDELGSCLMMLFFFSSRELAEAFCRNSGDDQLNLEQLAAMAVENFEQAMVSYAYISASISQLLPANDPESNE
jgi:yecA family protein